MDKRRQFTCRKSGEQRYKTGNNERRMTVGPAMPDAMLMSTKIAVPIIAPMPIPAAPQNPKERCNLVMEHFRSS